MCASVTRNLKSSGPGAAKALPVRVALAVPVTAVTLSESGCLYNLQVDSGIAGVPGLVLRLQVQVGLVVLGASDLRGVSTQAQAGTASTSLSGY